jgi:uncharacterized membrane protein YfcA
VGLAFFALTLGVAFLITTLAGLVGLTGGILLAPALLLLPPLVGLPDLGMKAVSGLTITQTFFAATSGALAHRKYNCVSRGLVVTLGLPMAVASLTGAVLSGRVEATQLAQLFALLSGVAAVLMLIPRAEVPEPPGMDLARLEYSRARAIGIGIGVGILGGLVGQGGSFLLIPLMLAALALPTRVVIGSNLAIVAVASLAGCAGKIWAGQIPALLAGSMFLGAVPGALLGAKLSHRFDPRKLKWGLTVVVVVVSLKLLFDAFV